MQRDGDSVHLRLGRSLVGDPRFEIAPDTVPGEDGVIQIDESVGRSAAIGSVKPALFLQHLAEQREHFLLAGAAALNVQKLHALLEGARIIPDELFGSEQSGTELSRPRAREVGLLY